MTTKTIYIVFCGGDGYDEEIHTFSSRSGATDFVIGEVMKHWGKDAVKYHNTNPCRLTDLCLAALKNHNYLYNLSDELEDNIDNLDASNCDLEASWWKIVKKTIDEKGDEVKLKKFDVHYSFYLSDSIQVEAENAEEAERKVQKMMVDGTICTDLNDITCAESKVWAEKGE